MMHKPNKKSYMHEFRQRLDGYCWRVAGEPVTTYVSAHGGVYFDHDGLALRVVCTPGELVAGKTPIRLMVISGYDNGAITDETIHFDLTFDEQQFGANISRYFKAIDTWLRNNAESLLDKELDLFWDLRNFGSVPDDVDAIISQYHYDKEIVDYLNQHKMSRLYAGTLSDQPTDTPIHEENLPPEAHKGLSHGP